MKVQPIASRNSPAQMLDLIELDMELTNGNDGRGNRWFKSSKVRTEIEQILRAKNLVRTPYPFPVEIVITRILGKGQRMWDFDSCGRGNSKELIDALVACGWFTDDSPKYVTGCQFKQVKRGDERPSVMVEVLKS